MKKISKYIQLIIFLSSFALMGFLIIQMYWAKNNFEEKKQNVEQLYEICIQEIGNQLNAAVLNKSSVVDPNLGIGISKIKPLERSYEKELSNKIYMGLMNLKNGSLAEKREEILNIVNSHYSMNFSYNVEKALKNSDIEEIIRESFDEFEIVMRCQLVEARLFEANVIIIVQIIDPNDLIATIQQYFGAMHADEPSHACH